MAVISAITSVIMAIVGGITSVRLPPPSDFLITLLTFPRHTDPPGDLELPNRHNLLPVRLAQTDARDRRRRRDWDDGRNAHYWT